MSDNQRTDKFHAHVRHFAQARGNRPNLPARKPRRIGGTEAEVQCPGCGAWRPPCCISETPVGWLGDCCISKHQRDKKKKKELEGEQ